MLLKKYRIYNREVWTRTLTHNTCSICKLDDLERWCCSTELCKWINANGKLLEASYKYSYVVAKEEKSI